MPTEMLIGKPIDRVDGRQKVTGKALYAVDFPMKNAAHAVAFVSTIARGRVTKIDAAEALQQPGVLGVLTHENAHKLYPVSMNHNPGKPGQTFIPMQGDQVMYAGQYLGVVIAETIAQALHAAGRVKISYETAKPMVYLEDALDQTFEPKKMGRGDKPGSERGKPDEALAAAAVKIDQTYTTPIENHNPMELSGTVASWDGDRLTLYDATQWVYGVRSVVSTYLGIAADKLRVIDPFVGGGFGCKGSIWPHEVIAALAARHVGRPVKLHLTRSQMFTCIGYRPKTIQRLSLGADQQGKLSATIHECTSQTSMWKDEWVESSTKVTRMLYACPNVRTAQKLAPVNANTPTQMRAPGEATGTFALEVAMDELAVATKVDPLELRLRNYAEKDEDKNVPFSSKALRECYSQGAERFGWAKRNPEPRSHRDGDYLIGWGMATATYPTNRQESSAKVRLLADGRAIVSTAAHDLGTGTYTTMSQIAAQTLGLPLSQVKVELADTAFPQAAVAGGSQTSASVGPAVQAACMKALSSAKERATADPKSPLFGKSAQDIESGEGRLFLKANPSVGESIAALLERNGGRPIEALSESGPPGGSGQTQDAGSGKPPQEYSKHAWGAQFCEVRVNERLGEIRVSRFVGAFAAGRILNALTARSQVMGGIVWGISAALLEQTIYDPNRAKVVNASLADYLVAVNPDIPPIDCFFVEEKDEHVNPLGVKGIGELGITGAAGAVANAVYHATGKRFRNLPITLDQLI